MSTTNFSTIADIADNIADYLKAHADELTAAAQQRNADLTPEANQREVEARKAKIRTEALAWVERQSSSARLAATKAEQALQKIRPTVDESSAASLVRAEQRWNYSVRPLLDAGQPLKELLKSASLDDLLSIERFAGGWLTAQRMTSNNPLELEPEDLEAAVLNRMVSALPEEKREEFEDAVRARHAGRVVEEIRQIAIKSVEGGTANLMTSWAPVKNRALRLR